MAIGAKIKAAITIHQRRCFYIYTLCGACTLTPRIIRGEMLSDERGTQYACRHRSNNIDSNWYKNRGKDCVSTHSRNGKKKKRKTSLHRWLGKWVALLTTSRLFCLLIGILLSVLSLFFALYFLPINGGPGHLICLSCARFPSLPIGEFFGFEILKINAENFFQRETNKNLIMAVSEGGERRRKEKTSIRREKRRNAADAAFYWLRQVD